MDVWSCDGCMELDVLSGVECEERGWTVEL